MGHNIEGYIAAAGSLADAVGHLPGVCVLRLADASLGFVPLTTEAVEQLQAHRPIARARRLAFPVAVIETEYFAGGGRQRAAVLNGPHMMQAYRWREGAINDALHLLGVVDCQGQDAFDTVGLGQFRSNEWWVRYAPRVLPAAATRCRFCDVPVGATFRFPPDAAGRPCPDCIKVNRYSYRVLDAGEVYTPAVPHDLICLLVVPAVTAAPTPPGSQPS